MPTPTTLKLLKLPTDASDEDVEHRVQRLLYENAQLEVFVRRACREVTKKLSSALLDDVDALKGGG